MLVRGDVQRNMLKENTIQRCLEVEAEKVAKHSM